MATTTSPFTRSVLGPLTTTFTRPSRCSLLLYDVNQNPTTSFDPSANQAQSCVPYTFTPAQGSLTTEAAFEDDVNCWPSATGHIPSEYGIRRLYGWGLYSPGLICPDGYTTACSAALLEDGTPSTITQGLSFGFQFSLFPAETAVGCCPSGYDCFGGQGIDPYQTCLSVAFTGEVTTEPCAYDSALSAMSSEPVGPMSVPYILPTTVPDITETGTFFSTTSLVVESFITTTTIFPTFSIYAPMIQLNWKASDRLSLSTSTANLATSTSLAIPTSSSSNLHSDLSISAKVAIGVTVPIMVLVMVALLAFVRFRRKNRKAPEFQDKPELDTMSSNKVGINMMSPVEVSAQDALQELGNEMRYELSAPTAIHELEGAERASVNNNA